MWLLIFQTPSSFFSRIPSSCMTINMTSYLSIFNYTMDLSNKKSGIEGCLNTIIFYRMRRTFKAGCLRARRAAIGPEAHRDERSSWSTPATGLPHSKQAKGNQGGDSRLGLRIRQVSQIICLYYSLS